jgi:hypothetical protein
MKSSATRSTASAQLSASVGSNDLRDILSATVNLVEPAQEKSQRLLLTVKGTSHHDGSVSNLVFDGRVDEKGVSYYRVSLASVYVGGIATETLFSSSIVLPPESEDDKTKTTEVRVMGKAVIVTPTTLSSRMIVKPVPLPHPR